MRTEMTEVCEALPEDGLQNIHAAALEILSEAGIAVDQPDLCRRLARHGCRVDGARVYMPSEVVADALRTVPPAFTLYGRSPQDALEIGLDRTCCTNTGIFANIYDFPGETVRRSTLADVEATTRLLDAMDNIHAVYVSLVDATDAPPELTTLVDFAAVLANTTKPLVGPGVTSAAEARAVVAMARAVRGSANSLREYPICVPFICPITPLRMTKDLAEALITIAEAGLPLDALTNPVMGVSSPYTLAGTLALGHAEVLATIVMAQVVAPGLPMLVQNTPSIADMRTMASTTGGPETGLLRQAAVLLARRLHLPSIAHGHTSSTHVDFQAGTEKSANVLLIASARPSVLGGVGALANATLTGYETIVLDNDQLGGTLRVLEGVSTDADHLAMDVILGLARGESALDNPHTLGHLRSGEVWRPHLAERSGLVSGLPGRETSLTLAVAETSRLLKSHKVAPLSVAVQAELQRILATYPALSEGR